jgi:SAM-dependent methyltransferase
MEKWDPVSHYQNKNVASEYDRVRFSSLAGKVFNSMEQALIVKAVKCVLPTGTVADIPCGTGRLAEPLLAAGYRVIGYDISADMLGVAHGRLARFGDAFRSGTADAFQGTPPEILADAVLCARVLMHFPFEEQVKFIGGAKQFGKGPIVITQCYSSPYQRFRRFIKRAIGNQPPANFPITETQIGELLARNALREVKRFRLNRFISEAIFIVAVPK